MPSNITTPATFAYTAGSLRNTRIAPTRLTYSASTSLVTSKDTSTTTAAEIPELDRLTIVDRIPGEDERSFMRRAAIWQSTMQAIEDAFTAINARVDEVAILARLSAVEAKAEVANDNAVVAKATADNAVIATQETFGEIDPVYRTKFSEIYSPL